ncbi:hypothetical protein VTN31DRAFT_330 [Thermomyces dupontii]|uniref:uncharacterized protein n=1 Tax=Talaromyces thermophilus TaxID=28565 RepID=UPI003743DE15
MGDGDRPHKKRNLGRNEYNRRKLDRRALNEATQAAKRRKLERGENALPVYATEFPPEEISAEERRPKKKVALLLSYAGSGYHGMQLSQTEKTIEGDLFTALVAAGAISKANANDPKKSSFVRCARTDKGVHAAGNVVSLKMIVQDPEIIQKINEHLNPQIRVWGYEITNKSFSCYHFCDSRVYEYLIPSHCFLPPHPSTFLGRKIREMAEAHGDLDGLRQRQEEVLTFWDEVDEKHIQPILAKLPENLRGLVQRALYIDSEDNNSDQLLNDPNFTLTPSEQDTIHATIRSIRNAYTTAKRAYRIPQARIQRIQQVLDLYLGTRNFHNYTVGKQPTDPSAKRVIKSFTVTPDPADPSKPLRVHTPDGTEWLSLKVHGQSFMMHQIRKMVAMAALVVRCGRDPASLIPESYSPTCKIAIPKAPGLGLLLERPIFDSYNRRIAQRDQTKNPIDFGKYDEQIDAFKREQIYNRIFKEEEETNAFTAFFNQIDHFQQNTYLYVTSGGVAAAKQQPRSTGQESSAAAGDSPAQTKEGEENQNDNNSKSPARVDSDDERSGSDQEG